MTDEVIFASVGATANFPLNPEISNENFLGEKMEENHQPIICHVTDVSKKEFCCFCRATNVLKSVENQLQELKQGNHHEHFPPTSLPLLVQEVQSSRCIYRNSNFSANFDNNPSLNNVGIQFNSRPEITNNIDGCCSRGNSREGVGIIPKKSIWERMRKFLGISMYETSDCHLNFNDETYQAASKKGVFEMSEFLVHDLRKYKKFNSRRLKNYTHMVDVTFESIHATAKYSMKDFQFMSEKFNGNGEMDLILNNVHAKIMVTAVKDNSTNSLKKIHPDIKIKFSTGKINFSTSSAQDNQYFNHNFKILMKNMKPTINGIVSKKIIDKLYPILDVFNEPF